MWQTIRKYATQPITIGLLLATASGYAVGHLAIITEEDPATEQPAPADKTAQQESAANSLYIEVGQFVVPIYNAQRETAAYLLAELSVSTKDQAAETFLLRNLPRLHHEILASFMEAESAGLLSVTASQQPDLIANMIVQEINERLPESKLDAVHFSRLMFQPRPQGRG
ncbi:hypothetical protein GCM10007972_23800 [Iodidimonas muriae]|uniref:Flagellar protein FliL n=1 Tax=Iodidimonas muriae TaxID=261467 RepID=A0ABQ2LFC9_9PROT|nr:flagellar basal body-associated FliL family protein [Iodidimonas muriae]GER08579.1 hypothetical protein JCM17843_28890 [Kordiimonadales bacterium JCM 17843]GGO15561.1 hypothetical protein GCM10007972_23800 [Iodidimonas muriae]